MKLEKYKKKDLKKTGIIIFTIACILLITGVFLYTSYASFETRENFNIINGNVQEQGDLYFAFYINENISKTMPKKGEGYSLDQEKTTCTNGASIEFDPIEWAVKVVNMTTAKTKCNLYFKTETFSDSLITCSQNNSAANCFIENSSKNLEELAFDNTADNNLRYIGANPNNYVSFNNELWRIIGAMNNMDDGTGKKETRLKIIRNESIGLYSWDNKAAGVGSSNSENGSNDWTDSALQIMLNEGAYWNRTVGECPYGQNGATTSCDFSSNGLTNEAKEMIGDTLWKLGGTANISNSDNYIISKWYDYERSTTVFNNRSIEWTGKIGLIYPSDYGFATNGGITTNRQICLTTSFINWLDEGYKYCYGNDWLFYNGASQWSLTPDTSTGYGIFRLYSTVGNLFYGVSDKRNVVRPSLYFKSNIKIISGDGSETNPYQLSM